MTVLLFILMKTSVCPDHLISSESCLSGSTLLSQEGINLFAKFYLLSALISSNGTGRDINLSLGFLKK